MNDPFVHEQAEGFARRLLAAPGDDGDRIRLAYRMALAREPLDRGARAGDRTSWRGTGDSSGPTGSPSASTPG